MGSSSETKGSSMSSTSGSVIKPRASATRRCMPSEMRPDTARRSPRDPPDAACRRCARGGVAVRKREGDVFVHRAPRQQAGRLEDETNFRVRAAEHDIAVVLAVEAGDDVEERGLAASGWPM